MFGAFGSALFGGHMSITITDETVSLARMALCTAIAEERTAIAFWKARGNAKAAATHERQLASYEGALKELRDSERSAFQAFLRSVHAPASVSP